MKITVNFDLDINDHEIDKISALIKESENDSKVKELINLCKGFTSRVDSIDQKLSSIKRNIDDNKIENDSDREFINTRLDSMSDAVIKLQQESVK